MNVKKIKIHEYVLNVENLVIYRLIVMSKVSLNVIDVMYVIIVVKWVINLKIVLNQVKIYVIHLWRVIVLMEKDADLLMNRHL